MATQRKAPKKAAKKTTAKRKAPARKKAAPKKEVQAVEVKEVTVPVMVYDAQLPAGGKPKRERGRPTSYRPEYAEMAKHYCLMTAATDEDLAGVFNVAKSTINKWKHDYPDFSDSIREGKDLADMQVANALFQRAIGMTIPKTQIVKDNDTYAAVRITEVLPPDVKAAQYWLNNRQRHNWKGVQKDETVSQGLFSINIHTELRPESIEVKGERLN